MGTLKQLKMVAKKIGATVEDEKSGHCHCCRVEAPHRFKWIEGGVHELVEETNRPWKPDYADILSRMEYGLEPCDDPDCDWCCDPSVSNGDQ